MTDGRGARRTAQWRFARRAGPEGGLWTDRSTVRVAPAMPLSRPAGHWSGAPRSRTSRDDRSVRVLGRGKQAFETTGLAGEPEAI
jgi:hypothetical protein